MSRRAFTAVEVLVAVAIIGVLIGMLLPAVQQVRNTAARAECSNRLRQQGLGLSAFQGVHSRFPPLQSADKLFEGSTFSYQGVPYHVFILPYVEQGELWAEALRAFSKNPDPWSQPHREVLRRAVKVYTCPADPRLAGPLTDASGYTAGYTSYCAVVGYSGDYTSGMFGSRLGRSPGDVTDGLSNTIMAGERPPPASLMVGWWYTTHPFANLQGATDNEAPADAGTAPGDTKCGPPPVNWPGLGNVALHVFSPGRLGNDCDRYHFWSLHPGGANFLFADGSVRFLTYEARFILRYYATVAGGEPVPSE